MKLLTKKRAIAGVFLAALLAVGILSLLELSRNPQTALTTQEDIARMVKPSVVRIIHRVTGKYSVPAIDINLSTLEVTTTPANPGSLRDLDEYITGSGFIISPEGYILTNSHVISEETIKYGIVSDALNEALEEKTQYLSRGELSQLLKDERRTEAFMQSAYALVSNESSFDIHSEVVVLNPASDKEDADDLFRLGFPAEVVNVNHDFFENERDIALIKINHVNLPAAPLSPGLEPAVGSKIYIFGFPATADFNKKNPLESTFTQGVVSASKFAESKEFKVYQTDAKISQGSSGGPMFNENGEVIGVITFQTGELRRQAGDNFAFALPIALADKILRDHKISPSAGTYRQFFKEGLRLYQEGRCEESLKAFAEAEQTNFYFTPEKYTGFYTKDCKNRIEAGESLDTKWELARAQLKKVSNFAWFVVIGRIVLALAAFLAIWLLIRRLRKDEQEITELEQRLEDAKHSPSDFGTPLPLPEENLYSLSRQTNSPNIHLLQYIKEARLVGMTDEMIIHDLKVAGWKEEDIHKAL